MYRNFESDQEIEEKNKKLRAQKSKELEEKQNLTIGSARSIVLEKIQSAAKLDLDGS